MLEPHILKRHIPEQQRGSRPKASPLRVTPSLHHRICVPAGPTVGTSHSITYQKPGPPNPWNKSRAGKSRAGSSCDPSWEKDANAPSHPCEPLPYAIDHVMSRSVMFTLYCIMNCPGVFQVAFRRPDPLQPKSFKIHQRGVQWKQGVEIYMTLCISLLCNTAPIHCTPLPLHPPVMKILSFDHPQLRTSDPVLARGHVYVLCLRNSLGWLRLGWLKIALIIIE